MTDAPLRLACPACLGVVLESAAVADGVTVRHCGRCGGTWLPRAQALRLREVPDSAVRAMIRRADDAGFLCHDCHAPLERDAATCGGCGWPNALECPSCGRPMRRETRDGVTVDVCRPCTAVWLDHHELSVLWAAAATAAVAVTPGASHAVSSAADAGGFLLDLLFYAPDVVGGAVHLAGAGVEVAGQVGSAGLEIVANAPELASGLAAAGEAAGGVFSFIVEVIGGVFDGL